VGERLQGPIRDALLKCDYWPPHADEAFAEIQVVWNGKPWIERTWHSPARAEGMAYFQGVRVTVDGRLVLDILEDGPSPVLLIGRRGRRHTINARAARLTRDGRLRWLPRKQGGQDWVDASAEAPIMRLSRW
jgi:hypothetical protein